MGEKLSYITFNEHLNTTFQVENTEGKTIELELIRAEEKEKPGMKGFTLIFKGRADERLFDNTYKFNHVQLGEFDLFISPYGQEEDEVFYDVQFAALA